MREEFDKQTAYCMYCPKLCRFSCCVATADNTEAVTPGAKMTLARLAEQGRAGWDGEVAPVFWKCASCLRCRTYCEHDSDVPRMLNKVRGESVMRGISPAVCAQVKANFAGHGNAEGTELLALLRHLVPSRRLVPEAQAVFFPGCEAIARQPEMIRAAISCFDILNIDHVAVFDGAACCGLPLYHAGHLNDFKAHARGLAAKLSRYKQIISVCPSCVYALKALYSELNIPLRAEILHLSSLLEDRLDGKCHDGKPVAYHDPCYLGRYLGEYEAPRAVLATVASEVVELYRSREDAVCCGSGGLLERTSPETARAVAKERMDECRELGVKHLISACPSCLTALQSAESDMVIEDLTVFLARRLSK